MKRFLPLIILILAPLSLLLAQPVHAQSYDTYVAQPGDSLWALAETKVPESENKTMVINAVKNLEIMLNNLDDTNYYLEIGQSYKLLTQAQINFLVGQISQSMPRNSAYLIANPAPVPNWTELRLTAQSLSPTIILSSSETTPLAIPQLPPPTPTFEIPITTPVDYTIPVSSPTVQGAHTSLIPLADSPFPY